MTGDGDGDAAIGRYAHEQFGRGPWPVIEPAATDPVIAALTRETDLSTLERLVEEYPSEALELVIHRNRRALREPQRRP